ncbi:hypothetical protein DSM112329_00058 [Paraconexibacter sp. AEG42_29]|uniref:Trm112 family protein n=1 Tax=Paraconexibacter sp. AEG42_29 TaxID=2997339 RepID=A0AAU7ANU8_9ACTN
MTRLPDAEPLGEALRWLACPLEVARLRLPTSATLNRKASQ